ncbi:PilZ domain-containing protein [Sphingomonas sp. KRR8]|uniref:PilZ domain-containing protein n=1 Tax=Sphingomonas sp. KRR8 TaxID=2942996 RepID=UPI00201FC07C|nr:PilZ domain-containing protein [Sphingomonas sp. KRR8]URD61732.1 PilZ domain-containing protein [Sphingomonas sp. KRR8]
MSGLRKRQTAQVEDQRVHDRVTVRCPARVRIGNRQHAAYLENISAGGARLRTFGTIRDKGKVTLKLPDLPPLMGELRWVDDAAGGVMFALPEVSELVRRWIAERNAKGRDPGND